MRFCPYMQYLVAIIELLHKEKNLRDGFRKLKKYI